jgi:hypothetical protein
LQQLVGGRLAIRVQHAAFRFASIIPSIAIIIGDVWFCCCIAACWIVWLICIICIISMLLVLEVARTMPPRTSSSEAGWMVGRSMVVLLVEGLQEHNSGQSRSASHGKQSVSRGRRSLASKIVIMRGPCFRARESSVSA